MSCINKLDELYSNILIAADSIVVADMMTFVGEAAKSVPGISSA